jgi:thiol-disulfide isomerase/thioredoxin
MSPHRNRFVAVLAPLLLVAGACGGGAETGDAQAAEDPPAAEPVAFSAAVLGGGDFDASSIAGQDAVLWFWAPWCTSCRAEAPDVLESASEFEGQIEVIGVAGRGEIAAMERFVSDTGTGDLLHIIDEDGAIWSEFDVFSQPAFAFIDDEGQVDVFVGTLGKEALSERMRVLAAT